MKLLTYTKWDALPVTAGILHCAYVLTLFFIFPFAPWWLLICMGFIYSISVSWNMNGISHNLIHNPYFTSRILNRLYSIMLSVTLGISQTFYKYVHHRHHMGNSDRPDENGNCQDWISIYRHGHDGEAENPWSYIFLSFFRDSPAEIRKDLKKRGNADLFWGNMELAAFATTLLVLFLLNWRYVLFYFLPFFYLGHCFSYLNGYFRHYGADPDKPIAWGVSSYGKLYNWIFFYNGYHAEHHFRPKVHWTKMEGFRRSIQELQKQEGVRVIKR